MRKQRFTKSQREEQVNEPTSQESEDARAMNGGGSAPGEDFAGSELTTELLEEEVAKVREEAKANYDNYLRTLADLDNYKKRAIKERSDLLKYAGEALAADLIEVLDNLDLALAQRAPGTNEDLLKGIEMIRDQFVAALARHDVRGVSGLGKQFDPNMQQAMASVPTEEAEPGTVIEEYKKAYFFKDKLLRTGQVVVAAAPE